MSSRFPLAAVLVLLCCGSAAEAARITIVNGDTEGSGFNDKTPVKKVAGNSGKTVGQQRLNVFKAAASELGRQVVSAVEIKVLAGWRSLACSEFSGALGGAGAVYVIRDRKSFPKSKTWYAGALAEALEGESFSPDEPIAMVFNPDVGTAGCLPSLSWDYRIGVFISQSSHISLFDTMMHEISHGLGFADFVAEDGTKLMKFNDAYMLHLEDHDTGKKWSKINKAKRQKSSTKTGMLDWVGPNVQLHASHLTAGRQDGSAHVRMYAPDPYAPGSSVSHWDTELFTVFDELMEPFSTQRQAGSLSPFLLQDTGWSINQLRAGGLGNLNGKGWDELAVLRIGLSPAGHRVRVLDPKDGELISEAMLASDVSALDLAIVPPINEGEAGEVAVLTWKAKGKKVRVVLFDPLLGEEINRLKFPVGFPRSLAVVPDFFGSPAPEIAVFGMTSSGTARIWIQDSGSGAQAKKLNFSKRIPGGFKVVPDFGLGAGPELVVGLTDPKTGSTYLEVRDAQSGKTHHETRLEDGFSPDFIAVVPDFGGLPAPEIAVLGLNALDGKAQVYVFDGSSGELLTERTIDGELQPLGIEVVSNYGGSSADEIAVLGRRQDKLTTRLLVLDAKTGNTLKKITLPKSENPRTMTVVPSQGGSATDDIVVLSTAAKDGEIRAYYKDGKGKQLKKIVIEEEVPTDRDLMVDNVSVNRNPPPGGTVIVAYDVVNAAGGTVMKNYREEFFLSDDADLDDGDSLLGSSALHTADLYGGTSLSLSAEIPIPADTPEGPAFLLVMTDARGSVDETNESNNVAALSVSVSTDLPDLTQSDFTAVCNDDTTVEIEVTVSNAGEGDAGFFRVGIYGSVDDDELTVEDFFIASGSTDGLPAGLEVRFTGSIPTDTIPAFSYRLGSVVDDLELVQETDETNNATTGPRLDLPCPGSSAAPTTTGTPGQFELRRAR